MKKYMINETYTASQNQHVFSVEKPFINDFISVFVNGALQTFGEDHDYITSPDTGRISFLYPLDAGDTVSIVSKIVSKRLNLEVISPGRADKPNALYKKYGTVERLKSNNKYEVCISIGKDEPVQWHFTTKLSPLFSSAKKIWEDIGEFIEGYTDEYINSMIYRNSVAVLELVDELAEEDIQNVTYEFANNEYKWSSTAPKDWVRYKTEMDLVMARYYGISYRYGTQRKEIGDLSIEKSVKLPYIDNLLNGLKANWKEADDKIRGVNVVAYGVKGIDNYTYDDWARTTNF